MPSEAARSYGDRKFVAMMLAKVFCVQMVSMLGYDFLFQDVDIVWYKHPLEYFDKNPGFDVYFQDDGAHSTRYAPYSANSGFYFVRHNDRTQFFLTSILMAGDLVIKTDSHQQALIALLAEHSSLYGLRVKVLSRDLEEFPGKCISIKVACHDCQWYSSNSKIIKAATNITKKLGNTCTPSTREKYIPTSFTCHGLLTKTISCFIFARWESGICKISASKNPWRRLAPRTCPWSAVAQSHWYLVTTEISRVSSLVLTAPLLTKASHHGGPPSLVEGAVN
jgi:hypothetical protein